MASKTIYDDLVKRVQQIFHVPTNDTKSLPNHHAPGGAPTDFYTNNPFDFNPQHHQKVADGNRSELEKKYQPYTSSHDNLNGLNVTESFMANDYNANYDINQPSSDYGCNQTTSGMINQNQSNDRNKLLSNEMSDAEMSMKSIKVTVGIDEDLKMILEMDPSIVDLGGTPVDVDDRKLFRLPPLTGG